MTAPANPRGRWYQDKAVPYIIDFTMVDANKDGAVDANEFAAACQAGWVEGK